jgi:hypothetical protein
MLRPVEHQQLSGFVWPEKLTVTEHDKEVAVPSLEAETMESRASPDPCSDKVIQLAEGKEEAQIEGGNNM